MRIILLLSLFFFTFLNAVPLGVTCPDGYFEKWRTSIRDYGGSMTPYDLPPVSETRSSNVSYYSSTYSNFIYAVQPDGSPIYQLRTVREDFKCVIEVVCDENQTLDTSVNPHVCIDPISCPSGTHDVNGTCVPDVDSDNDGVPDYADPDDDNDGVPDLDDDFPTDPNESNDNDNDGLGDNSDSDDDNDGVPDYLDTDDDNDGYSDSQENLDGTNSSDSSDNSGGGGDGGGNNNGTDDKPSQGTCLDGMYYDLNSEKCICNNGYPSLYNPNTQQLECQVPKCAIYDSSGLPLFQTNVSRSFCDSLSNNLLGFRSTYYVSDSISCCYSDTYSNANGNDCPPNYQRDSNGICVPITGNPDNDIPECFNGYEWDSFQNRCVPPDDVLITNPDGTITTTNPDGTTTTTNPDGTITTTNPDGTTESSDTLEFKNDLEYNEKIFDDIFTAGQSLYVDKATDGLTSLGSRFINMHTINIPRPTSGSCGCTDETFNFSFRNVNETKTIEYCKHLETVFTAVKYVLWLLVTYSLILKIREIV